MPAELVLIHPHCAWGTRGLGCGRAPCRPKLSGGTRNAPLAFQDRGAHRYVAFPILGQDPDEPYVVNGWMNKMVPFRISVKISGKDVAAVDEGEIRRVHINAGVYGQLVTFDPLVGIGSSLGNNSGEGRRHPQVDRHPLVFVICTRTPRPG